MTPLLPSFVFMPNSIICVIYIQTCIKILQKAITSLSYSSWNSKIIWFALLTYCITCDKCCEDHKEGVEIGAHVGSQTGKTGFAYSREEKTKGDLIAILPFQKGGGEFWLFTEGHNEEKRWQSQVARKFQPDIRKNSPWRWFNARTDCPENLGISILSKF